MRYELRNSKSELEASKLNVKQLMQNYVVTNKPKNSLMFFKLQNLEDRINLWKYLLPRVKIFYSVRSNSD